MSSDSELKEENMIEFLFITEDLSSGDDPPMSEWSSLEISVPEVNKKRLLHSDGVYSPGSGEICTKYIAQSASSVFRHPYYNYPAVLDPGIKEALLTPERPVIYTDDGQRLYLDLCKEMNMVPVRMFYNNLITDEINLSYYGINPNGVRAMANALQYNKCVSYLNLTDNFLNDDACYHLGQMLNTNSTLKELDMSGCHIGSSGMLRLGTALSVNRTLITVNLSRNSIGEQGGVYFAKQLYNRSEIKRVNLNSNQLGVQTALALAETLEYKNKMTHLDLSHNNFFHSPSTAKLLEQLAHSEVLQVLNFSWNAMEGERAARMIEGILKVPTLTTLDLSHNRFQGEAIPALVESLIKAKKLMNFDLSYNPLNTEDSNVVIDAMLNARVKLVNLFLDGIWVNKRFKATLERVRKMKARKNFKISFDGVLEDWTVKGPDPRETILNRADFLCKQNKKQKVDLALFFLQLKKEFPRHMSIKDLQDRIKNENLPLTESVVCELANIFPVRKSTKTIFVNIEQICEYIHRKWPGKELPPTPPPEPETEPEPEPAPEPPKGKRKSKGKK